MPKPKVYNVSKCHFSASILRESSHYFLLLSIEGHKRNLKKIQVTDKVEDIAECLPFGIYDNFFYMTHGN